MNKRQIESAGKRIGKAAKKSGLTRQAARDYMCELSVESDMGCSETDDQSQDMTWERIYDVALNEARRLGVDVTEAR